MARAVLTWPPRRVRGPTQLSIIRGVLEGVYLYQGCMGVSGVY